MVAPNASDVIPPEVKHQLQQTLEDIDRGIRRDDKMIAACERMDRMRTANQALLGQQNCAVDLIRETREVRAR